MRVSNIVLGVLALASTSSAFFPWYPDYRCAETNECVEAKGSDEGHVVGRGNGLTIKIAQRLPKIDDSSVDRIRQLGEQLREKYQRGSPIKQNARAPVAKRTNTYRIMPAATPTQKSSAGIDQDGTDYSYFAQVQLGSTNAPIHMLLDTGADSSWVMGSSCGSGPCLVHDLYSPTTSTSYKALGQSFSVSYGSGSVSGVIGTDDLTLAGLKIPITLGIANVTSTDFNNFPIDGILGLSLGQSSNPSFIQSLVASKALSSNIFGMSLNRASDGPNTGEINFGSPDTSRYSGELSYTDVSSSGGGFWALPMANVGLGTTQAGITSKLAYIDTGTSFIFCSSSDAKIFHSVVPGATTDDGTTWHVPCSTTASVTFTFGSTAVSVSTKDWMSPPVNGVCTSNIYGHDIVSGNWLLGDTFLKNVYAVFDADKRRVGFAQNAAVISETTATTSTAATTSSPGMTSTSIISGSMSTTVSNGPLPGTTSSNEATFTALTLTSIISPSTTPKPNTGTPGLNGHETMNANPDSAVAQTSGATTSPTAAPKNSGPRLQSSLLTFLVPVLGFLLTFII